MKKGNLKNVISEHVEGKSLSRRQLDALIKLQKKNDVNQRQSSNIRRQWLAIATVFLIVIGNLLYFSVSPGLDLEQRIGNEVAKNHINLKPLEIETSSLKTIGASLTELGFLPVESVRLDEKVKSLLGGRYCSIQGVTAAQLRFKDNQTGQIHSLYQTIYTPKAFSGLPEIKENQEPVIIYSKGLAVEIWVEKGLLFALTREVIDK